MDAMEESSSMKTRREQRRQSKIVCTIGPKTSSKEAMSMLADVGMNIVRLNMSHGTHEWHQGVIDNVRLLNRDKGYNLGILLDTKGPEVRSGDLKAPITVERGDIFTWTVRKDHDLGEMCTEVSYDDFVNDVQVGDTLLVDGGISSFLVTEVNGMDVVSECIDGGVLTSRRHLNVRGKSASLPAITDKDWQDIAFGLRNDVDFYALSFVKHEDDVRFLRDYLRERGCEALVLPKIESAEAVPRLRQILEVADGAMVARGDLGAEIPVEDVPLVQEEIIQINRELKKPTIVATHMLESMITYASPTRAEVTDITEAIKQGADATMLSGETAGGDFPREAVETMSRVAQAVFALKSSPDEQSAGEFYEVPTQTAGDDDNEESDAKADVAYSAAVLARDLNAAAVVIFTRAGNYAREVSAVRPRCPILAFSPSKDLNRRLMLSWGVDSFLIGFDDDPELTVHRAMRQLRATKQVAKGDVLVIVSDMLNGAGDSVNTVQVRVIR
eukprot:CAMPEP_0185847118 /NCGR_PEP_ID=MMETSP1354-20130828/2509_1 /TAXON_ID=708628 /ORGANISM="Erythrolobus madagascarensis, Strain CCMP3276" /LENGTH=499 /DNA_ID=CAMNT_0028547369 /DNA_START=228 /DNA_END=1727 /DNA_ORIENTATION=-